MAQDMYNNLDRVSKISIWEDEEKSSITDAIQCAELSDDWENELMNVNDSLIFSSDFGFNTEDTTFNLEDLHLSHSDIPDFEDF